MFHQNYKRAAIFLVHALPRYRDFAPGAGRPESSVVVVVVIVE